MAASSPPAILLLLLLLLFLLAPRTPQLQLPNTVLGAGDKHASVRDKTQIPGTKKTLDLLASLLIDKMQIPSTKNTRITHVALAASLLILAASDQVS